MFEWLNWGTDKVFDFRHLAVDMHAHWLPGIDDGAKSMRMTLHMLQMFCDLGYTQLIATPHIMADYYPNNPHIIRERLQEVRDESSQNGINLDLYAAAEYMIDEEFEDRIKEDGVLALPGGEILVEFGFIQPPLDVAGVLFRLQTAGYQPVLAHPERYMYYHNEIETLEKFVRQGIRLQVNLLSLLNHYGKPTRIAAERLIRRGLVSYLGTDAHHPEHLKKLTALQNSRRAKKVISSFSPRNQFLANEL